MTLIPPTSGLALWFDANVGVTHSSNRVSQVLDLSGNDDHAANANTAQQPLLIETDIGREIRHVGTRADRLVVPSGFTAHNRQQSVWMLLSYDGQNQTGFMWSGGPAGAHGSLWAQAHWTAWYDGGLANSTVALMSNGLQLVGFTASTSAGVTVYNNQHSQAVAGAAAGSSASGATIGAWAGTDSFASTCSWREILVYDHANTAGEIEDIYDYFRTKHRVDLEYTANVMIDGDSFTSEGAAGTYLGFAQSISRRRPNWRVYSIGVGGSRIVDLSNRAATFDAWLSGTLENVAVIFAIRNDLAADIDPFDAAEAYAALKTYCLARRAAGWTVVLVIPPPWAGAGYETERAALYALIVGDPSFYDALADYFTDPLIGLPASIENAAIYPDDIHPNDAGYTIFAPYVIAAVEEVLPAEAGSGGSIFESAVIR